MIDSQNFLQAKSYHDLQGLESLKKSSQKSDDPAALSEAAKHFEAFFLQMILKSAREANYQINGEESIFNSQHMQFYQEMLDEQMSVEVALSANQGRGLGVAEMLTKQLTKKTNDNSSENSKDSSGVAELSKHKLAIQNAIPKRQVSFKEVKMPEDLKVVGLKQTIKYRPKAATPNFVAKNNAINEKNIEEKPVAAVKLTSSKKGQFANPADFVEKLYPIAKKIGASFGLDPKILLAQSALETGWGKFVMASEKGSSSHNLFGIKADARWHGESVKAPTIEFRNGNARQELAEFRTYNSFEESMEDYVRFLTSNPRYKKALENKDDPQEFAGHLQKAGYATDPKYAAKIMGIMDMEYLQDLEKLRF